MSGSVDLSRERTKGRGRLIDERQRGRAERRDFKILKRQGYTPPHTHKDARRD
jgi:hypothetical protein